jgi:uncharacterized protein YggU (UPF0235/DUF167 family)
MAGDDQILVVRVQPGARQSAWLDWEQDEQGRPRLRVAVAAAARDHAANIELLRFVAKALSLPKASVQLRSGEHSRVKTLLLPAEATQALPQRPSPVS